MIGHLIEFLVVSVLGRLFPRRFRLIPRMPDGAPLLRQFKVFETKEPTRGNPGKWHCGIYLQSFVNPEIGDEFHIHRWARMLSFVLCGMFVEERYPGGLYLTHTAPSVYGMNWTTIHRFHAASPRTWTLFFMFGRNTFCDWGYFPRPNPHPWSYKSFRPWHKAIPEEKRIEAFK